MSEIEVTGTHYIKNDKEYVRWSTISDYFPHPDLNKWKRSKKLKDLKDIEWGDKNAFEDLKELLKNLINETHETKEGRSAKAIGTKVDKYCCDDAMGKGYKIKKSDKVEVKSAMEAWERWKRDWPERFEEITDTQQTALYDDWGVGATLDIISPTRITDIKTSKKVSNLYWLQLAVQNRKWKRDETWVLDLSKFSGDYEYVKCPEKYTQEYLEQVFIGMVNVYHFFNSEE